MTCSRPFALAFLPLMACLASGAARAADMALPPPPRTDSGPVFFESGTPVADSGSASFTKPPPPMFDFSGIYAGLNLGYAFDSRSAFALTGSDAFTAATIAAGARPAFASLGASGFTGGAEIGINKEFASALVPMLNGKGGGFVLGAQADAAFTALSSSVAVAGIDGSQTLLHERTGLVGTLRARAGIAFDKLLVFGTGGLAFGSVNAAANTFTPGGLNDYSGALGGLKTGYAFGGGIEYAIEVPPLPKPLKKPGAVLKVEYIHYDLGTSTFAAASTTGAGDAYNVRLRNSGNLIRAAVDFKFDPADAIGATGAAAK